MPLKRILEPSQKTFESQHHSIEILNSFLYILLCFWGKLFGMKQNRNKKSLQEFENNLQNYIESPDTKRIPGSYRYETPAYHYKKPNEDLIVTVNATDNTYISVRNATDFQLEKLKIDGNLSYDNRPTRSLTLRLQGPKQ